MIKHKHFGISTFSLAMVIALSAASPALAAKKKKADTAKDATHAESWNVDAAASNILWHASKVTGKHDGEIKVKEGKVEITGDKVTGGTFAVDMTTIKDTDIQDPSFNAKLINHLKTDDFFGVEKNPVATFKITAIKGENITGDMTIKGITNAVTFPAKVTVKDGVASAEGTVKLDRTKWNIKYGSGKFFQNLGDKTIHDEFTLDLKLVAKK